MFLNIKTEFSFRQTFAPVERIITKCKNGGFNYAGIADLNNTFGFVPWEKECIKQKVKPIFGVTIAVCPAHTTKDRRGIHDKFTFIARNQKGLSEIYQLVETAYKHFYYVPRLSYGDVSKITNNVVVIGGRMENPTREDFSSLSLAPCNYGIAKPIAMINNQYIDHNEQAEYESLADARAIERSTYPLHIPRHSEWNKHAKTTHGERLARLAMENMFGLLKKIDNVKLQKAPPVRFYHESPNTLMVDLCKQGAKKLNVDLSKKKYKKRLKKEIDLILEKDFQDYFLVVADVVEYAKRNMLVGPGRGSSGGSLVCYLMGITTIDPIKYNLIFERFIDVNRTDLPDIDIDFPDNKRFMILQYLTTKYHVCQIANITTLSPRSNLNRVAKALGIEDYELTETKKLASDVKADAVTVKDILTNSEPGKDLVKAYPPMEDCIKFEDHATHSGVHAAGIIVSNEPITDFTATILSKKKEDGNKPIACLNMEGAEHLELLKIDALGLKNLTFCAEAAKHLNWGFEKFYSLEDGNKKAYSLLNGGRMTGIFQLGGRAIRGLMKNFKLSSIEDIAILSSIGRPGPMKVGASKSYIRRRNGEEKVSYPDKGKTLKKILSPTLGLIIYQEQIMYICRDYAGMNWPDVIKLRKVVGKSKGSEELTKFREMFIKGAKKKGHKNPKKVWEGIKAMGSYGFNKSHAIAYSTITYWTAYLKANYPSEYATGFLNHATDDNQKIKMLRYLLETEGIKHRSVDRNHSTHEWGTLRGKLLGPLTGIKGIGPAHAATVVRCREQGKTIPKGILSAMADPSTPFDNLYPRKQLYGSYKGTNIIKLKPGKNTVIAKMVSMNLRDANSVDKIRERGGKKVKGPTSYLTMILQDDTGEIMGIINRNNYPEFGKEITETGEEDKSWYVMKGTFEPEMNLYFIDSMAEITIGD